MVKPEKWRYGVVLDAGSSGTRIHIYRWLRNSLARLDPENLHHLPELETKEKWTEKIHPGISTFGETPQLVGPDHLEQLLKHALKYVPVELVSETPIFLLATAGVRLLPQQQRTSLLANVCSYIQTHTKFQIPDCALHVQVISGQTEGIYGWLAANYLLGGFDAPAEYNHGKDHHTYGFLDMGGASAQIAFAPNATEAEKHADDLSLVRLRTVAGETQEYRVFVTTWLGFGVNEARRRYVRQLIDSYPIVGGKEYLELPDPCLPSHITMDLDGKVIPSADKSHLATERHLLGTGNFDECLRRTLPLLEKDLPCPDPPCLMKGQHVPAIDFDVNHFIGISEYWHTTHEIFESAHDDKAFDFNTYQTRIKQFCERDWSSIQADIHNKVYGKKVDEQTAYEVCFKASWLISVLHDGIGIPRIGLENTTSSAGLNGTKEVLDAAKDKGYVDAFQAVKDVKSTEVSWTLGKMVLYAAADVPVSNHALPVGFGSNIVGTGIPHDFQFPGGGRLQGIDPSDESIYADESTLSDSLFRSDAPHRLPGFILFLLIIIIVAFYLCGREKRSRLYSLLSGRRPSNGTNKQSLYTAKPQPTTIISTIKGLISGRSFRNSGPTYSAVADHDLESGDPTTTEFNSIPNPEDFELGSLSRFNSHTRPNNDVVAEDDNFSDTSSTYASSFRRKARSTTRLHDQLPRSRSQSYSKTDKFIRHSSPSYSFKTSPTNTLSRHPLPEHAESQFRSTEMDQIRPGSSSGMSITNPPPAADSIDRVGMVVRSESREVLAVGPPGNGVGSGLYSHGSSASISTSGNVGGGGVGQRAKSRAGSPDHFSK